MYIHIYLYLYVYNIGLGLNLNPIRYIDIYLSIYLYTYIERETIRAQNHKLVPGEKSILLRAQQI